MHTGFPGGSAVKNLPTMQEMWVWPLGGQDLLEKEMATHSSIFAWEIHEQRNLASHSALNHKKVRDNLGTEFARTLYTCFHLFL